jgi:hypothetical protein
MFVGGLLTSLIFQVLHAVFISNGYLARIIMDIFGHHPFRGCCEMLYKRSFLTYNSALSEREKEYSNLNCFATLFYDLYLLMAAPCLNGKNSPMHSARSDAFSACQLMPLRTVRYQVHAH